jgi:hypothetical protein
MGWIDFLDTNQSEVLSPKNLKLYCVPDSLYYPSTSDFCLPTSDSNTFETDYLHFFDFEIIKSFRKIVPIFCLMLIN